MAGSRISTGVSIIGGSMTSTGGGSGTSTTGSKTSTGSATSISSGSSRTTSAVSVSRSSFTGACAASMAMAGALSLPRVCICLPYTTPKAIIIASKIDNEHNKQIIFFFRGAVLPCFSSSSLNEYTTCWASTD